MSTTKEDVKQMFSKMVDDMFDIISNSLDRLPDGIDKEKAAHSMHETIQNTLQVASDKIIAEVKNGIRL